MSHETIALIVQCSSFRERERNDHYTYVCVCLCIYKLSFLVFHLFTDMFTEFCSTVKDQWPNKKQNYSLGENCHL